MRRVARIGLWLLPLIGLAAGYAYAYTLYHGVSARWLLVGKPADGIARILGTRDDREVIVATEGGEIYALLFDPAGEEVVSAAPVWRREQDAAVDRLSRLQYFGADFFTAPLRVEVVQVLELAYLYRVEGKREIKLALAADGNLWIWHHQVAGLTGLVFFFYPLFGLAAGAAVLVAWLAGGRWRVAAVSAA